MLLSLPPSECSAVQAMSGMCDAERNLVTGRIVSVMFGGEAEPSLCKVWLGYDREYVLYIWDPMQDKINALPISEFGRLELHLTDRKICISMKDAQNYIFIEDTENNAKALYDVINVSPVVSPVRRKSVMMLFGSVDS